MKTIHDLDITEIVAAVIDDDAASIANSLAKSLQHLKDGQYTPTPLSNAPKNRLITKQARALNISAA